MGNGEVTYIQKQDGPVEYPFLIAMCGSGFGFIKESNEFFHSHISLLKGMVVDLCMRY